MNSNAAISRSASRPLPPVPSVPGGVPAPARGAVSAVASVFRCGELPSGIAPGIPTGFAGLDAEIPGGGWPVGALTEVLCDACGIGELSLLLPALRHLTRSGDWRGRGLLLIDPPHLPYAPALAQAGIDLDALAVVRPRREDDGLWAAEQALRSGAAGAVLLWARPVRGTDSAQRYQRLRRLQLAAAAGGGLGIVFSASSAATLSTPAALRLSLVAGAESTLAVSLVKRRGLARPVTVSVAPKRLPVPYLAGCAGAAASMPRATAGLPARIARSVSAVRAAAVRLTRERDFMPSR